jgi:hypothetical protein
VACDWLTDLGRAAAGDVPAISYWDYTAGRSTGMGIADRLALARSVAARLADVVVDREERKPSTGGNRAITRR